MSLLAKILGGTAGAALGIPPGVAAKGGDSIYKGLKKVQGFLGKVASRKKTKEEQKIADAAKRLAVLQTFQTAGTANTGTDFKSTPAQLAALGPQPSEAITPIQTQTQTKNKMMNMEWVKTNWMYLAGGAAVLYFLFGRKKRR